MVIDVLEALIEKLEQLGDGELLLTSGSKQWRFYLLDGQLLYASSSTLTVRRFERAARCYKPRWEWSVDPEWTLGHRAWELALLERAMTQNQLSPIQIKLILRMVVEECLVELLCEDSVRSQWNAYHLESSSAYRSAALSASETRRILSKAQRMAASWRTSPLGYLSLSVAPMVEDSAKLGELAIPAQCLRGDMSLWDIVVGHVSSLSKLTQLLSPLAETNNIRFQSLSDLPLPLDSTAAPTQPSADNASRLTPKNIANHTFNHTVGKAGGDAGSSGASSSASTSTSTSYGSSANKEAPLIACIDDSPVLTLSLKKILTAAGYRTLSIPEPMRGFSKLIEYQPDLILLDLMLPNANGYSICKFLRETPTFAETPIIILTGQNSNLDRMRARLSGASEFLTKPPKPAVLLDMIECYLKQS